MGSSRLLLLLVALAAACTAAPEDRATEARRPPNIVYVLADDLGYAELGCYGQTRIRTPNADRLAAEGMRFTRHYAGAPVCAPSRCVLLTGLHSGHAYVRDNMENGGWGPDEPEGQLALPTGTRTLAWYLRKGGYATAAMGKWGLGGPGSTGAPERMGFDRFYGYLCQRVAHNFYPTHLWRDGVREELEGNAWGNVQGEQYSHDLMAEEALRFIEENADRPFFLFLPFTIPHLALQVPEDSLAEYRGQWDDPPYEGGKGYLLHPTPRAAYAAMVTRMDRDVGRILATIERLGLDEDTVVMFSSDNGPTYDIGGADSDFFESTGGLRGRKGSVFEGGLRVPLIVRWPGVVPAGVTSDHVSAFEDLLPTLLDLAGQPAPDDLDGISFAPTLRGEGGQREHDALYWEFPGYGGQQAVLCGSWKGVRRGMRKGNESLMLFDLAVDPAEEHDVAALHPELVHELLAAMDARHEPSELFPMPLLDD